MWRICCVNVGTNVSLNLGARIIGPGEVEIGESSWLGVGCTLIVPLGAEVYIGSFCDIAPDVIFECGSHNVGSAARRAGSGLISPIFIGAGTWVGIRVTILGGVTIGSGSVVAAGAVVLPGTYPDNALLAGVPARVVKLFADL